jgi:hypothetical protein
MPNIATINNNIIADSGTAISALQPLATNLTSLAGLTYVSASFVKMTAAGTYSLDTNTYYLNSNPSSFTSNLGTVTSVAALTLGTTGTDVSSSVATGTTTPVITLNIPTASATNRGALSSTDWSTFNGKQAALTNPVTGTGTTNYLPKFTGTSTIGNSLIWDNGTNVGIGTTSPAYKLDVNGSINSSVASGNGSIYFNNSSLSGKFWTAIPITNSGETDLQWYYGGTSASTKLTFANNGNVGIGTSTPIDKLTIYAAGQYPTNIGDNVYLGVANDGGAAGNMHQIGFGYNSGATSNYYPAIIGGISESSSGQSNEALFFATRSATTGTTRPTERMRITSGGDVFINQSSGDGGEGKLRITQTGSLWGTEFRHTYSTQYWCLFKTSTTGIGSIVGNGSTTSFNPSSDRRLKENIKPIENAIDKVMKLKPVTYDWINTGISDDGFIAQDLLELDDFKHRVNGIGKGEDGTEYYGVDYMRFVSILTAAIQEQNQTIQNLQEQINILQTK